MEYTELAMEDVDKFATNIIQMQGTEIKKPEVDSIQESKYLDQDNAIEPVCICGNKMTGQLECTFTLMCNICCKIRRKNGYICNKGQCSDHPSGYGMCDECAKQTNHFDKSGVNHIHNTIYYVSNDNHISGPHNTNEIISLYISRTFKYRAVVHITSAFGTFEWHQIHIPTTSLIGAEYQLITEYEENNKNIKEHFPLLYHQLIEKILTRQIRQISLPPNKPPNQVIPTNPVIIPNKSCFTIVAQTFAVIFATLVLMQLLLGMIIHKLCVVISFGKPNMVERMCPKLSNIVSFLNNVVLFSGYLSTPIAAVSLTLAHSSVYYEIQSWMVAYLIWGISSFTITMAYAVCVNLIADREKRHKYLRGGDKTIAFFVGVDLSEVDLEAMIDSGAQDYTQVWYVMMMLLPALVSLLPAIIGGFIANFVLVAKYQLKCTCTSDIECCQTICIYWGIDIQSVGGMGTCQNMWIFVSKFSFWHARKKKKVILISFFVLTDSDSDFWFQIDAYFLTI